jgi:large repetitive protein
MMSPALPAPSPVNPAVSRSFAGNLHRNLSRRGFMAVAALVAFAVAGARAQTTFPATNVGSTSAAQTVTVTAAVAGTVSSVEYLTFGAANLDFVASGSGGTCTTNPALAKGQTCAASVDFDPKFPGDRFGAVVLLGSSNQVLGTQYLYGRGMGPLAVPVPGTISIAAGQEGEWTALGDNGPATDADLYLPSGIAIDGAGDVFIADSNHNRIREILATGANKGNIITVAGDGEAGYSGTGPSTATTSPLNIPSAVAIDGAGNLYIADTNNNVIREVNLTLGTIVTVAGNGQPGYSGDGGAPTSAMLNSPKGISVDGAGNLYIADTGNNIIREVTGGKISTIAGTPQQPGNSGDGGPATSALLAAPYGVAFDSAGNMYIPDSGNNKVRVVSGGIINNYAGTGAAGYSGDGGAATSAQLDSPFGVATDAAGNVYIADARNYVVRRVAAGDISTVAGNNTNNLYNDGKSGYTYGNGQSGEQFNGNGIAAGAPTGVTGAGIYAPYAVAVDPTGNMLIAEYYDQIIREVNSNQATFFVTPQLWVNQVSAPQDAYIQNIGDAPFTSTSIQTDINAEFSGAVTTCTSAVVDINDQCLVGAQLAPTAAGNPLVGNVTVTSPGANPTLDIQLVGQVLAQNQVDVALTSSPNPSNFGQNVALTVTVTQAPGASEGTPTGTVSFTDTYNGTTGPLGTPQTLAGGKATLNITTLGPGTHNIVAAYSGNTYYLSNTSNTVTQVVNEKITVTLVNSSGNNPSILGTNVTFQATVTITGGIPVNNAVSFYDGTTFLGSAPTNASGVATYQTAALPLGSDSITASYTDANSITGTSAPLIQKVEQQTATVVTSGLNPSLYGQSVTFTATVTATGTVAPTGKVTFYNGATSIGTGTLAPTGANTASATFAISTLPVGTDQITATYAGDADDFGSTSAALAQVVNITTTTTTLTASANPVIAGTSVTLTATVTATSGTVTPTGTVNFMNGTTVLGAGTLNAKGVATYTTKLPIGTYSLTAVYLGDNNDSGSTSTPALSLSVVGATTNTTLAASATTITPSTAVVLTATVTGNGGAPTGTVSFMDGTTNIGSGTLSASGVATATVSNLAVGTHSITAVYSGDANNGGSTSNAVVITVNAWATTTVLAASATQIGAGQPLALVAVVNSAGGAVTGTVTFVSGGTTMGTGTVGVGNSANLNFGNLSAGTYTITAKYSGDTNDAPSTSNAVTVTVGPTQDFTVQLSPASLSIPTKEYGMTTITLTSENGFTDTIALGCSSLPFSVTCNFSTNDITLPANGSTTVQLTVDTNSPLTGGGQAKNEMPLQHSGLLAACALPGAVFFGLGFWRFRKRHAIFRVLAVVAMLAGTTFLMNGCGGISLNSAKAGTYTIQVTASGMKSGVNNVANLSVQVTQ